MTSLWETTRGASAEQVPAQTLPADEVADVVVVGAGITGLTTAYLLTQAGRSVVVVEARAVGAGTTGNTTAKVSLLQGSRLSSMRRHVPTQAVRDYVTANRAGLQWLVDYLGEGELLQHRDAVTYAETGQGARTVRSEFEACREAGLEVELLEDTSLELPFRVKAAVRLGGQAQIHPLRLLDRLAGEVRAAGGVIVEGARAMGLHVGTPCRLETSAGEVLGRHVVLATGVPVFDRGLHFARLVPQRSYAMSYRYPGSVPQGMYLSVDRKTRSIRSAPIDGEDFLVIGGNGHTVGRHTSAQGQVDDLLDWAGRTFPGAELTDRWSAQDYRSADYMPVVGPLLPGNDRVLVATGYYKWGMTNGVAAALALAGQITGEPRPWGQSFARRGYGPVRAAEVARINLEVGAFLGAGWITNEVRKVPDVLHEGQGLVGRSDGLPTAVSYVDGERRAVSAVCTHLGGIVRWNDAECTWDCPLHGSRFTPDGTVIEGPATRPLPPKKG